MNEMQLSREDIEKRYLAYRLFGSVWFMGIVWLLYYRLFMSDQAVGILDGISFGVGLLIEIPSGALADHFWRKKIVVLGTAMLSLGMASQGLANGYGVILIGQMFVTAGSALRSGADDALFYDALKYDADSSAWKKLVSKGNQLALATTLFCYLVGAAMYNISPRLVFLSAILGLLGILAVRKVPESNELKADTGRYIAKYWRSLVDGSKQLLKPEIRGYLPVILIIQGLLVGFGYGLLRPILQSRFGYGSTDAAVAIFICALITLALQRWQYRVIDHISEKRSIITIGSMTALALLFGATPVGRVGILSILVLYASEYLIDPFLSNGLNKHVDSRHRATALSAASFLKGTAYVIMAPIIGFLNVRGMLWIYLSVTALLVVFALIIYSQRVEEIVDKS